MVVSWSFHVSWIFSCLLVWGLLKSSHQVFCRRSLSLDLSSVFSLLDWSAGSLRKTSVRASISLYHVRECVLSACIPGNINTDRLITVVSVRFLHCKVMTLFFPVLCSSQWRKRKESEVAQSCLTATPGTVACQAPLSIGFSRKEHWMGCHFLLHTSS